MTIIFFCTLFCPVNYVFQVHHLDTARRRGCQLREKRAQVGLRPRGRPKRENLLNCLKVSMNAQPAPDSVSLKIVFFVDLLIFKIEDLIYSFLFWLLEELFQVDHSNTVDFWWTIPLGKLNKNRSIFKKRNCRSRRRSRKFILIRHRDGRIPRGLV